jgi:hypothetical protein
MTATYGPRHREESHLDDNISYHNDILYCNGTTDNQDGYITLPSGMHGNGSEWFMDDIVTKNFHSRKAKGEIFNNPCISFKSDWKSSLTGYWSIVTDDPCSGLTKKSHSGNSLRSLLSLGHIDPDPGWNSYVGDMATVAGTQAWSNVVAPNVLSGENGRDARATYEMLRHPLLNFHNFLDKVRRTKKFARQSLALGEFVAGEWLKYRYGATPLLYDLEGAFEAVFKPTFSNRYTARGSASAYFRDSDSPSVSETYFTGNIDRQIDRTVWVRAGVLYEHEFTWSDKFGLSMHNILPTLWEWLPYSFVADWFVNAGDFIGAVTPKANVKVLADWTTVHVDTNYKLELTSQPVSPPPFANQSASGGPGFTSTRESQWMRRTPSAKRGIALKLYDFDLVKDKNWLHLADGCALAGQKLMQTFKQGRNLRSGSAWDRNWRYGSRGLTSGWKGGTL